MNIKNSVLYYIKYQQLNSYGHVQRLDEERLPQRIWNGVHLEEVEAKEDPQGEEKKNFWSRKMCKHCYSVHKNNIYTHIQ